MNNRIKVMVVDDSALVRKVTADIIGEDPELELVAQAADPLFAIEKLKSVRPDVITLDIEMPRMDGLTFLGKLMRENPIPVVICSSLAEAGADSTLKALEYGAVEIIAKPQIGIKQFFEEAAIQLTDAIKSASKARLKRNTRAIPPTQKLSADAVIARPASYSMAKTTDHIIAIGASTGGTEAIKQILTALPRTSPGIVAVQHMPEKFTSAFARRLNDSCVVEVREATDGDRILTGQVLIAPGNHHMLVKRTGAKYYVEIISGPLVNRHRPSVDVLFRSVARYAGANAVGCILTGMGDDGAAGLLEMRNSGSRTIGQDEASSIVYGMPKEAFERGAVETQLPLEDIPEKLVQTPKALLKNLTDRNSASAKSFR